MLFTLPSVEEEGETTWFLLENAIGWGEAAQAQETIHLDLDVS